MSITLEEKVADLERRVRVLEQYRFASYPPLNDTRNFQGVPAHGGLDVEHRINISGEPT